MAPRASLRVVANRGETLLELVRLTFAGRVHHASAMEVLALPRTSAGDEQRVGFIVDMGDGYHLLVETSLELLRKVVDELEPWDDGSPH